MTTVENELATFWKEILHYDDVLKEEDNFFQLGANSIHAIHFQHFVNKKFNLSISFKNIFENQTISALSTLIETKREHAPASSLDPNRGNGINYQTSNNTFTQEESTKTILTQTFIEPDVIRAPRKNKNHGSVFLPVTPGVLIGKPIPNSTAYILDDTLQLLPIGVKGEIYLGGPGVAREYINNEEKTKERFVDDPFSEGDRLYKTGDLGRWLEDGNIEFHGRNDNQIKLRGFRIELGEIEQAIANHDLIDESVLLVVGSDEKDRHLVCFYTGHEATNNELATFLKKTLPDYMIPVNFTHLAQFPINTNGKIDRLAIKHLL